MKKITILLTGVLLFSNYLFSQTKKPAAKDLTEKIEKMVLKEGENKIEKVNGALSIYAKAEKGVITSYFLKDRKNGKEYSPALSEEVTTKTTARMRPQGGLRFCRVRYVIDGRIIDFIVLCSGQVIIR